MPDHKLSDEQYDNHGRITLGGSSNAYTVTSARAITGLYDGLRICAKANHTNNGAATLNLNGLGAIAIRKGASTALSGNEILSGKYYDFLYEVSTGFWQLIGTPPTGSIGSTELADGGVTTAKVADDAVTYAKIQNVSATSRILGRKTSGSGDVEECTLSETLDFIGSAAQGDILYRGASAWARLGAGTSGQYLKTQGASANPAWSTISQDFVLLTSGTVSAVATLDIALTSYTAYKTLMLILQNFIPATDGVALWARSSTDGGSTYDASAGNYRYALRENFATSAGSTASTSAAQIVMSASSIGNDSVGGVHVVAYLHNWPATAPHARVDWIGSYYATDDNTVSLWGDGRRLAAQDADAIRILFSSGNITSGKYALYGWA